MLNPFVPGLGVFLRDYFAGQIAMSLANGVAAQRICDLDPRYNGQNFAQTVAINAYEFADAMLEARLSHSQPAASLNGFKTGDAVELVEPSGNGADAAIVTGFNFGDPSRPLITVKPFGGVRPYDSDPTLWKSIDLEAGEYITPAGRRVHLVNYESQTDCCWLTDGGRVVAFVSADGAVELPDEDCSPDDGELLVPNAWPLPSRALANIDTFIATRLPKTQADNLIKEVASAE